MNGKKRYQQSPSVYSKKIHSGWVILEENKHYFRQLNDTAGYIWEIVSKPTTKEEIILKLSNTYHVPQKEIERDVTNFLRTYHQEKFINITT